MTFQEAFTKHKKIVFHGHEKGYYLPFSVGAKSKRRSGDDAEGLAQAISEL